MPTVEAGFQSREWLIGIGPTLTVQVGWDLRYYMLGSGNRRPDLPATPWPALVDTGASSNGIDARLAKALDLPRVDKVEVIGVHGVQEVDLHLAQIYIPALGRAFHGRVGAHPLADSGLPHALILGRTFLQQFTMVYEGKSGRVTLQA